MIEAADIAVGADAFLERRAQVLDGIEFVPEHLDRFASDDVLEVWKDIAAIEAGPVGNGRGVRISAILRSSRYLDRELVMSVPMRVKRPTIRVMVTPAVPITRVVALICQCAADRASTRSSRPDQVIAYQRAVARRENRVPDMRVDHVSINARGEFVARLRGVVADGIVIDEAAEIVLAGDIVETGDR